jgi:hypothetical protein
VAIIETSAHRGASIIYISHALLVRVLKGMQTCLIERGCNYLATLRCTVCMLLTAYAADRLSAASCPHPRKPIIQGLSSNLDLCRTRSDDTPRLQCFVSDLHQG